MINWQENEDIYKNTKNRLQETMVHNISEYYCVCRKIVWIGLVLRPNKIPGMNVGKVTFQTINQTFFYKRKNKILEYTIQY